MGSHINKTLWAVWGEAINRMRNHPAGTEFPKYDIDAIAKEISVTITAQVEKARREERERIAGIASFTVKIVGNAVIVDKYD